MLQIRNLSKSLSERGPGPNRVTLEVRGRPGFLSVDPFERRIEVERADNVRALSAAPGPS